MTDVSRPICGAEALLKCLDHQSEPIFRSVLGRSCPRRRVADAWAARSTGRDRTRAAERRGNARSSRCRGGTRGRGKTSSIVCRRTHTPTDSERAFLRAALDESSSRRSLGLRVSAPSLCVRALRGRPRATARATQTRLSLDKAQNSICITLLRQPWGAAARSHLSTRQSSGARASATSSAITRSTRFGARAKRDLPSRRRDFVCFARPRRGGAADRRQRPRKISV